MNKNILTVIGLTCLGLAIFFALRKPAAPPVKPAAPAPARTAVPAFDPARLAALETTGWQTIATRNPEAIGRDLGAFLAARYAIEPKAAAEGGRLFTAAIGCFMSSSDEEQKNALANVIAAYTVLQAATRGSWDPQVAGQAELQWWTLRRKSTSTPPDEAGQIIAQLYATLGGTTVNPDLAQAGLLRAQAAWLRDSSGLKGAPDWAGVTRLLEQSYQALARGLAAPPAKP